MSETPRRRTPYKTNPAGYDAHTWLAADAMEGVKKHRQQSGISTLSGAIHDLVRIALGLPRPPIKPIKPTTKQEN